MEYNNPVKISFDVDLSKKISSLVQTKEKKLIFCSKRLTRTEIFSELTSCIGKHKIFTDIENNPTVQSLESALSFTEGYCPDSIIAIGGGSVIDTAKISRFAADCNTYDIRRLLNDSLKKDVTKKLFFIAVPTTHGSASELTMWATLWDKIEKKKHSISDPDNYPDCAIYDLRLFKSLPIQETFISTLDALSHSFEALWNKNANPFSDNSGIEGIRLILNNINKIKPNIDNKVRKELVLASIYAGLAFSNTKTAAAHSISYPLTLKYNIPHGIACSMPLYSLLEINYEAIQDKLKRIFVSSEIANIFDIEKKIKSAIKNIIPYSLSEYRVKKEELNMIAEGSFTKERMSNNIVTLSFKDVMTVLNKIL